MIKQNIIEKLLDKLSVEFVPELVPTSLEEFSKEKNCFYDVQQKVKLDGGKIHNGWILHENEFFYEAERHTVWENNNEDLINITPQKESPPEGLLFVSDNNGFEYDGQFLPNLRVNSTNNKVVDDYIYILSKVDFLYTFNKRVSEKEVKILEPIKQVIDNLEYIGNIYYSYLKSGGTERAKCFCGTPKIYRNCHRNKIKKEIDEVLKKVKVYSE